MMRKPLHYILCAVLHTDAVLVGLFQMDCVAEVKQEWIWYLLGPLLGLAALAVAVLWLVLTYRARLLEAWETRHINALKRRSATPTLLSPSCCRDPCRNRNTKLGMDVMTMVTNMAVVRVAVAVSDTVCLPCVLGACLTQCCNASHQQIAAGLACFCCPVNTC